MNTLHHRPLLPTLIYLGIASVLTMAALLLTATAAYADEPAAAQGPTDHLPVAAPLPDLLPQRVDEPGLSLTAVNASRFTASGEIYRGDVLFRRLRPGEVSAHVIADQRRARFRVKLLEANRTLQKSSTLRQGRGGGSSIVWPAVAGETVHRGVIWPAAALTSCSACG